jgi:predicted nuclease of predicted toxin-antitoxin system
MKFLVDMNLSPLWVPFFANYEIASVHWSTMGEPSASDSNIMEFAAANDYVVFTHDLDFGILLATYRMRGPSVIQLRSQEVLPSAIGGAVMRAIRVAKPHLEKGAIVTVDPARQRIRLLPIR